MELDLAVLADAANVSREGKLNILGEFNAFTPPAVPAAAPPFVIVVRLLAHASEVGAHTMGLRLRDDDGALRWSSPDLPIAVPVAPIAGLPIRFQFIAALGGIELPKYGSYEFEVVVDGRPAVSREGTRAKGAELHVLQPAQGSS